MGTCFGILDMFSGGFSGSRSSIVIWIVLGMRVAFLPTAAGILVAVPATCLHNYLRTRLESLKRELSNSPFEKRRFPLNARLSQFPYAVITAPALAVLIAGYMTFPSLRPPKGLPVRLMSIGALETKAPPVEPIVIAVVSTKTSVAPVLYVNSKKTPWDELENKLRSELRVRPPQSIAYVQADKDAYWKYVADVIDIAEGLHAKVVLLTTTPDVSLSHMRQRANPHR